MLESYMKGALLLSGLQNEFNEVKKLILNSHRIILLGNGGSFSCCEHMAHDFLKVGGIKTLFPDSGSLLTCLFNDFGKEDTYLEWIKIQREPDDMLIAVSSSGESNNIINAVKYFRYWGGHVVTITAFNKENRLSRLGDINIHFDTQLFGVHELMSECFLHAVLDSIVADKERK